MKKFHLHLIFIFLISFTIVNCFPCPTECICKSIDIGEDFSRMSYIINCTNVILNDNKLIYNAEPWTIIEDKNLDDKDDEVQNDYSISIDLSNSSTLKQFHNKTIQLNGFSFTIHSLSLTNQSKNFSIQTNAFNSTLYEKLKILNLSSCCQQIPNQCPQLLQPLKNLEILDLSGSDLYKTCLNTPGIIFCVIYYKTIIIHLIRYDNRKEKINTDLIGTDEHEKQIFITFFSYAIYLYDET